MRKLRSTGWIGLLLLGTCGLAGAELGQQDRAIYVNGEHMDAAAVAVLDQINCNVSVPPGRYWLDLNTGSWGFEGGPQEGVIGACGEQLARESPAQDHYIEDRIFNRSGISIIQNPVY